MSGPPGFEVNVTYCLRSEKKEKGEKGKFLAVFLILVWTLFL